MPLKYMKNNGLSKSITESREDYTKRLTLSFNKTIDGKIAELAEDLIRSWIERRNIFICGNGGSAANAIHIANDFHYGVGACGVNPKIPGLRVEALSANTAILSCLANDTGYENIYSHQLKVKGSKDDLLIALSGSGNSENIIQALNAAKSIGIKSHAIIAFNGGKCLELADNPIHFEVQDMQIAEDIQLIVGHILMQYLSSNKPLKELVENTI